MSVRRPSLATFIWAATAAGAAALYVRVSPDGSAIPGVVEVPRHALGAPTAGRVRSVVVTPGQRVSAGDVLATLEADTLDADIAVARGELAEAVAAADAAAAELNLAQRDRKRGIATELARAQAALAAARSEQAAATAEARVLVEQLERFDAAARARLAEAGQVGELRARAESLDGARAFQPEVVRAWSSLTTEATGALAEPETEAITRQLAPTRALVETRTARLAALVETRDRMTLRAPADGVVARVLKQAGDAVVAAEPVVQVVARGRATAVAYAPEQAARHFAVGQAVRVVGRDRTLATQGVVEAVGPEIAEQPVALWLNPQRPRYGRPVYIRLQDNAPVLSAEVVSVSIEAPPGGAVAAPAAQELGAPLQVPAALTERSAFEVSGAIWLDAWQRFLVVSDDTGRGDADAQPWLFTVSADGVVDPGHVELAGLGPVSDLESIAQGPDGRIWLLCSQSVSRKGNRPEKRQRLAVAELTGAPMQLRVVAQAPLYDRVAAALTPEARAELGWGERLDIEGLLVTADALYLGLKAPTDAAGRARVLRLTNADAVLTQGAAPLIEAAARFALPTGPAAAPGGISDLAVRGDTLYLTSTLEAGPDAGALWTLPLAALTPGAAPATPSLVQRFDGLKPEGIAFGPDGAPVVFFDTGDRPARWLRLTPPTAPTKVGDTP